jgi:hypothetical protein
MEAFFLDPANRDFAEGKGLYQPPDLTGSASMTRTMGKFLMIGGVLATLGAGVVYLYQEQEHELLLGSVKSVAAQVSGCEGPGRYEHIRFGYTVGGKAYDQSAYSRSPEFLWPSTMTEACKTRTVELNYLASDPNRWSAAPISPLSGDERDAKPNGDMFIAGPMIFALGGIFAVGSVGIRKQIAKQDALKAGGIVLKAELLRMEDDTSEESPYPVVCYYQFINPAGGLVYGKSAPYRGDLEKRDYPQTGTPVYLIYTTDQCFEML